jgi:hypothetical protein
MAKRDWVEATLTSTVNQNFLCGLVLNIEKMMVKFNKNVTIPTMCVLRRGTWRIFFKWIGEPAKEE